jgi:aspartyl-tRNA(Asn)/glutamyl-tRNA(Gln) amidotransferase subunit B
MNYETVIGLEVHVQIKTESKLFCSCPTTFGAPPNSNLCPVCAGYPGVLPVVNKKAVELLTKTALALDCHVRQESFFARKQYFYPDLPKGYQISQFEKPLAEKGFLALEHKKIGITRIHLEEDAGKLIHSVGPMELNYSLVDLNRTGIALMEIVSEPEIGCADEAQEYLVSLKTILQYLEVSDCDMEKGSLRCDANVSIRPTGTKEFGTKVELKNMNSFKNVHDALNYEIERQINALESKERIIQETRLWNPEKKESRPMRSKEQAHDYRYFPEPDLLPLVLDAAWIENIKKQIPELPHAKRKRFLEQYFLPEYDVKVLTADKHLANFYEKSCRLIDPKTLDASIAKMVSNWITTELLGRLNAENKSITQSPISPERLSGLMWLILKGTISGKIAKTVFDAMWNSNQEAQTIVQEKGLLQVSDLKMIEQWIETAIQNNTKAVEEFRNGKERAIGALVGAVMKLSKGQANPELVNQILKKKLT